MRQKPSYDVASMTHLYPYRLDYTHVDHASYVHANPRRAAGAYTRPLFSST